jgi:hypothetical protein
MKPCLFGPLTFGHLGSMVAMPAGAVLGVPVGTGLLAGAGAVAITAFAWSCLRRHHGQPVRAGVVAFSLGSYLVGGLHGAGLALVPAFMPACVNGELSGGSLLRAVVPLALHIGGVLIMCWLVAALASRLLSAAPRGWGG